MNYMDLYNACDIRANKGLKVLEEYLNGNDNLTYFKIQGERITTLEVEYWLDHNHSVNDVLGVWEFNDKGFLIE